MKILDHQHEGGTLGEAHQQREDTTEELDLFEFVGGGPGREAFVPQSGEEPAEIGDCADKVVDEFLILGTNSEVAKGIDEGNVGKSYVPGLHTATEQYSGPPLLSPIGEFSEQASFAHTRVARDEGDRAPTLVGSIEKLHQAADFLGPSDKRSAVCRRDAGKYPIQG
jgi:hypothetical protein